jgi:hypothetical protein
MGVSATAACPACVMADEAVRPSFHDVSKGSPAQPGGLEPITRGGMDFGLARRRGGRPEPQPHSHNRAWHGVGTFAMRDFLLAALSGKIVYHAPQLELVS